MRTRLWPAVATLLLVPAALLAQDATTGGAPSQTPGTTVVRPHPGSSSVVDVGLRGTSFGTGSDEARFQRYRDLRNGPTLDVFRYAGETDSRVFKVQADHVGYRDQRYSASYNNYGKLKVLFEWNQTPLFYSQDTATLFTTASPGVLRIDDGVQGGIQNGTTTPAKVIGQAQTFDLRDRRDVLRLD